jgi:hypothetical protein
VNAFLVSVAVAVAHALGMALRPLWTAGPATPVVVPLCAGGAAWLPLRPVGLPGDWPPIERGAP